MLKYQKLKNLGKVGGQKICLYITILNRGETEQAERPSTFHNAPQQDVCAGHDAGVPPGLLRAHSSRTISISECTVNPSPWDFPHLNSEGKRL